MTLNIVELETPVLRSVPRDGWDRPLVVPECGGKPLPHTRTTTFIDCIEDKSNLTDWGKRMVLAGVAAKPSLLDAVRQLDPEDSGYKKRLSGLAEAAVEAAGANEKREHGTALHGLSELVDQGQPLPQGTSPEDLRDMAAYKMATVDFDVLHIEKLVVCNELQVAGTPDRVARYVGLGPDKRLMDANLITDLKTGTTEYGTLKMAMQLAIYSRGKFYDWSAFPVDPSDKKALAAWKKREVSPEEAAAAYTPLPDINQDWGVIINLPAGSGEATLYWADLQLGWRLALLAREIRAARKEKNALVPMQQPRQECASMETSTERSAS